jgi:hypothetical protein
MHYKSLDKLFVRFSYQNKVTDEEGEMTEAEVRAEIIDTLQHDMEICFEHSDDEIAANVNALDIDDFFNTQAHGIFEGRSYDIQRI